MRLLREPVLHFLLIGGVLFALRDAVPYETPAPVAVATVVVDAAQVGRLRRESVRETGRQPDAAELQARIDSWVDDELLLREALRLNLARTDPVVRERLVRNMRFIDPGRRASEQALLAEAEMLGMPRTDPVARRRLVQVMQRRLTPRVPVDEVALNAYLRRHDARYARPDRFDFVHVYLRDDGSHADPRGTLERLRTALAEGTATADDAGDPFLLGARLSGWSGREIGRRFGSDMAHAAAQAAVGEWLGPLRSPYGWHLLRVDARMPGRAVALDEVGPRLVQAWIDEQRRHELAKALQALRQRYAVRVADSAEGAA